MHELRRPDAWAAHLDARRGGVAAVLPTGGRARCARSGTPPTSTSAAARRSSSVAPIKQYTRREEIVLATKVSGKMHDGPGGQGLSRAAILEQVDASLTRLGTDYIDVYMIHRFDEDTPVEETMEALHDVVKAGKVRYLGASSMWAWQFAKMQHAAALHGWTPFVAMEDQYNLIKREEEREMLPMCLDMGVGCVPYSPQGKGRLTRPWGSRRNVPSVDVVAKSFDLDVDQPVVDAVQTGRRGPRGLPWRRSHSPGCCPSPSWLHRSSARPSRTTSQTPSLPSTSRSPTTRSMPSKRRTPPSRRTGGESVPNDGGPRPDRRRRAMRSGRGGSTGGVGAGEAAEDHAGAERATVRRRRSCP